VTQIGNFTEVDYEYELTPLDEVESVVKAGAGLGRIGNATSGAFL
jgi:pectate lyase